MRLDLENTEGALAFANTVADKYQKQLANYQQNAAEIARLRALAAELMTVLAKARIVARIRADLTEKHTGIRPNESWLGAADIALKHARALGIEEANSGKNSVE